MKLNIWSIIFIGLGIICIFIAITSFGTQKYANRIGGRILILGIILIVISLLGMVPNWRSDNKKEAEKFNLEKQILRTIVGNAAVLIRNHLMGSKQIVNFFT